MCHRMFRDVIVFFISTVRVLSHKINTIASSGNFRWPISIDFKLDTTKRLCIGGVRYISNRWVQLNPWLNAVVALFTHCFESPPS